MDRWIRRLKSVDITDLKDGSRIIKYTNSLGDKIEIQAKQVRVSVGDRVEILDLEEIESVDMNPMFKKATEEPYLVIKSKNNNETRFLVDTCTNDFHDLPTV